MKTHLIAALGPALLLTGGMAFAQQPQPQNLAQAAPGQQLQPKQFFRIVSTYESRWWTNPEIQQKLNLSTDQQQQMDEIFQQNRVKLIYMNASLQAAEATLEPLMSADEPDEAKITAQIDKIAEARAELEKQNARMQLGFRRALNLDQWKQLQAMPLPGFNNHAGNVMYYKGSGPDGAPGVRVLSKQAPQE